MLHQMLSSTSPSVKNGEETIVVQHQGAERREFILLTRMAPPPPSSHRSSPPFLCASADLVAFDSSDRRPLFGLPSSPLSPAWAQQNAPLTTDDGTAEANGKHSQSFEEEANPLEKEEDKGNLAALLREGGDGTAYEKTGRPPSSDKEQLFVNESESTNRLIVAICRANKQEKCQNMTSDSAANERFSSAAQALATPIYSKFGNRHLSQPKVEIRRHFSQCQRLQKMDEVAHRLDNGPIDSNNTNNNHLSPASVDPSDPYQCRWCQFNTLYKGNMKRHLITCHQVSVAALNRVHFDVERLRKCSGRRPTWDELPIRPRRDGRDDGWTEAEGGPNGDNADNGVGRDQ